MSSSTYIENHPLGGDVQFYANFISSIQLFNFCAPCWSCIKFHISTITNYMIVNIIEKQDQNMNQLQKVKYLIYCDYTSLQFVND